MSINLNKDQLRAALEVPPHYKLAPSFTIYKKGGDVYAMDEDGNILTSDEDAATVIQAAINASTNGEKITFKNDLYLISSRIDVTKENITFEGEGWGTELRASASMSAMFNIGATRYIRFKNLFINGYGLADKCINAAGSASSPKLHTIEGCKIWGGITCCVDFSGCEDSAIIDTWVDGRRDLTEPPLEFTDYGIYFGTIATTGRVELVRLKSMFLKKADVYVKNVSKLDVIGGVLASKGEYSEDFIANMVLDGSGAISLVDSWIENTTAEPNIFVLNNCAFLEIISSELHTGGYQNIKADTGKSVDLIAIYGGRIARTGTGTHVAVPCAHLIVLNTDFFGGNLPADQRIDLAGVNRYWLCYAWMIRSNIWRAGTATISSGQTSVTAPHGMATTPSVVVVTPRGNIGNVWVSSRDSSNITINCSTAPTQDTIVDFICVVI
jgi:hypothetical protein